MIKLGSITDGRLPAVLSIAGCDPSGGAGIEADLKTITAYGMYGMAAVTALTVQNTLGVSEVSPVPSELVGRQIEAVISDITPDAVKIGMLGGAQTSRAVADILRKIKIPTVCDPVLTSTSGAALTDKNIALFELMSLCTLVTPNIPEAEILCGAEIRDIGDMRKCAEHLSYMLGGASVLIKGGHADGGADDVLISGVECTIYSSQRSSNPNTHGTGCTLSSAIACGLARGDSVADAVRCAKVYVTGAIASGLKLGVGRGPLDHMWQFR
ncbi:MAG: bifunctional hydroxymethylpyrimidine kinase/phosphomethylpyrimidine kinase [Eubacteriales bacterium]